MLQDYTSNVGDHHCVRWKGWMLSNTKSGPTSVQGMHDQVVIHNGKNLTNPLDNPVCVFPRRGDVCAMEHIGMIYNKFTYDEHGLHLKDIQRTNM